MISQNNFVFLDSTTDYPYKFSAGNTKIELLSKGLLELGDSITIINSPFIGDDIIESDTKQLYDGITCYTFHKKKSIWGIIIGYRNIMKILKASYNRNTKNFIVVSDPQYFFMYLIDVFFSRMYGFKLCVLFHEWHISIDGLSKKQKIGFYFFDHFFGYLCNIILPISNFLEQKSLKFKKPMLKIPILAEYNNTIHNYRVIDDKAVPYFLYCAGAQYINIINTLLEHYEKVAAKDSNVQLMLVLYGENRYFKLIEQNIINRKLQDKVKIVSSLPYHELFELYSNALALLIPLSNTTQDKARFSQKIAEYLSSGRPIITTNIGEIPFYFKDEETAFIAEAFESSSYSDKMIFVIENKDVATRVGQNGYILGKKEFENKEIAKRLHNFIEKILN